MLLVVHNVTSATRLLDVLPLFGTTGTDVLPLLFERIVTELPVDEFRVAAVLHPNIWHGHGTGQVRTWLDRAVRAGVTLVDPLDGWRQALVAADAVLGDFGSVTYLAAAQGTPAMLAARDLSVLDPDSPVGRFVQEAPVLDPFTPLRPQLEQLLRDHQPLPGPAELTSSVPGQAGPLLRRIFYGLAGLPEPEGPALLDPLPLPAYEPAQVTAPLRVLTRRTVTRCLTHSQVRPRRRPVLGGGYAPRLTDSSCPVDSLGGTVTSSRRTVLRSALTVGGIAAGVAVAGPAGTAAAATASGPTDWIDVTTDHAGTDPVALGDGTTDDTAAINRNLARAGAGAVVYLPAGVYATSAPLVVPPGVTLLGSHGAHLDTTACSVRPLASFSGAAVVQFLDQASGGYGMVSNEQRIFNLSIEGTSLPAGNTVDGVQAVGYVHGVVLQDVSVHGVGGHGIANIGNSSGVAYSWRGTRLVARSCGSYGFSLSMTDATWVDLEAIGCGKSGFYVGGAANSHFIGCRAEWNGYHGVELTGSWGSGTGSGGVHFTSLSTDRNKYNGVCVTATGNAPAVLNGLMLRRDGRNGGSGGGGYAGLQLNAATIPVAVTGLSVFPGVDDDGTGANSPQYGVSATASSFLSVSGGYLQAATAPVHDGGGNAFLRLDPGLGLAAGPTNAPVPSDVNAWGTAAGAAFGVGLAQADQIGLVLSNTQSNVNQPLLRLQSGAGSSDNVIKALVAGDAHARYVVGVGGRLNWGSGTADTDTDLYRAAAGILRTDGALSAGQGFRITEGTDGRMGTLVLKGTTEVTVPAAAVTADSRIFLTVQQPGGTVGGVAYVSGRTPGASFRVKGLSGDTSTVAWLIVEPA